jgi:hypothetical protein
MGRDASVEMERIYSGTLIYRSCIDHFSACTVRHCWSQIKFHINNVIYSHIHRSPNYRFPAFVCKSLSRHSISRMDRLKKNEAKYVLYLFCVTFSLDYKSGNTVMQSCLPRDLQLRIQLFHVVRHRIKQSVEGGEWWMADLSERV